MSDTPRTDVIHEHTLTPEYAYEGAEAEAWEWAKVLERELNEANKDVARLEFLLEDREPYIVDWSPTGCNRYITDRDEIDELMEEDK